MAGMKKWLPHMLVLVTGLVALALLGFGALNRGDAWVIAGSIVFSTAAVIAYLELWRNP